MNETINNNILEEKILTALDSCLNQLTDHFDPEDSFSLRMLKEFRSTIRTCKQYIDQRSNDLEKLNLNTNPSDFFKDKFKPFPQEPIQFKTTCSGLKQNKKPAPNMKVDSGLIYANP